MKKLSTTFAVMAVAVSAVGANPGLSSTVDPAGVEVSRQINGFDWSAEVNPAEGTVELLEAITVTFPGLEELESLSKDDIALSCNGTPVAGVNVKIPYGKNYIVVTLANAIYAAGEYTLSVPAGCIAGYDADGNDETLSENLEFHWTIEGATSDVDFTCTSSLPTDGFLAYFGELTITFDKLDSVSCEENGVSVTFNGEVREATVSTDKNRLIVNLKNALNFDEGKVVVTIAPEALTGNASGTVGTNPAPISLEYTMAAPVEYTLELAISTPKPNNYGQISAEKDLESIFFSWPEKNLVALPGTEPNVTIKEVDGDFEATAHLRKTGGVNSNYSYFTAAFGKTPTYNGKYTITIDRGAFGTESWLKDPNYGRTNDQLVLTFELIDGADRATFTLEPVKIDPVAGAYLKGEDIATVTLTFESGISLVDDASATLAGVDNSYAETAEFEVTEEGFRVTFENAPEEDGQYLFTVAQGMFGDDDFVNGNGGLGSAPISIEYTVDRTVGVNITVADRDAVIYNLQGMRMVVPADRLPAGVYVVDGKKVAIKK